MLIKTLSKFIAHDHHKEFHTKVFSKKQSKISLYEAACCHFPKELDVAIKMSGFEDCLRFI